MRARASRASSMRVAHGEARVASAWCSMRLASVRGTMEMLLTRLHDGASAVAPKPSAAKP
jgi:hypothetical protein